MDLNTTTDGMNVFDRASVRLHRARAANAPDGHDFLFVESAERLVDRLDDVKRTFPFALDLGCHAGQVGKGLNGRGGIETLIQCDLAPEQVAKASGVRLAADEERLPFQAASFDLVLSNLSLHWTNDLPGALIQINQVLKNDGLFLGSMLAENTLWELRESLMAAEMEVEMGMSPRVSPLATVQDLGALLQRAGFALPVIDTDTITVMYSDPLKLMRDLRLMGESNAIGGRRKTLTRKDTMAYAANYYMEKFGIDGHVPATFTIATMTAWTPDASQPQPLKPGAQAVSLHDALKDD